MEDSVSEILLRQLIATLSEVKSIQNKNSDSLNSVMIGMTELTITQKSQQDRLNSFWKIEWANLINDSSELTARVSMIERQLSRGEGENLSGKVDRLEKELEAMKSFKYQILATSAGGSIVGGAVLWFVMNFLLR